MIKSYWINVVSTDMCEFYICLVTISLLILIIKIGLHVNWRKWLPFDDHLEFRTSIFITNRLAYHLQVIIIYFH